MDMDKAGGLMEWVKLVEDIGISQSHPRHHTNIVHQIISFALSYSNNASISMSNDEIKEIVERIASTSINPVLNPQTKSIFSQGVSFLIESLIHSNDSDNLGRILMWAWSVYESQLWHIIPYQYFYQSILISYKIFEKEASAKSHKSIHEHSFGHIFSARPNLIAKATVAILSSSSFPYLSSYSLMVIESLRKSFCIYTEGNKRTINPMPQFSFDILIALFQACIPHCKTNSITLFVEILTTVAQYDNTDENIKASLHKCLVSMLEALAENSCAIDILPALSSHLPSIFAEASLHHRTRIMTILLNNQYFLASSTMPTLCRCHYSCLNSTILSILQRLMNIIAQRTTLFCAHHDIGNYQGFSHGIYTSTLLTSVLKMDSVFIENETNNTLSIDALLTPTLALNILESKSKEIDMNENLSYILKCIEISCWLNSIPRNDTEENLPSCQVHDSKRLQSALFTRQGVLLSIQHDEDDVDQEESSTHGINDMTETNDNAFNWRQVCSSEESLWQWVCRPSEAYTTLSEVKLYDSETPLGDLLQLIIERLLVCKFLIHRLVYFWSALQGDDNESCSTAETIYVGMEQIIAQVTFCKNLISVGKATAILQEQKTKQPSLPTKNNRVALSITGSIRIFNILQSHANTICEAIPLQLWKESITFAVKEDPCVIYTGTMYLLLEAFAYISSSSHVGPNVTTTDKESLEQNIVEIIWSHVPLYWQCLECLRKDKHHFKRLKLLPVYSSSSENRINGNNGDVYLMDHMIMDPIEKHLVHGGLVKHADYRWFVSALLSFFANTIERFPCASDGFVSIVSQEHQQKEKEVEQIPDDEGDNVQGQIYPSIQPTMVLLDLLATHMKTKVSSSNIPSISVEESFVNSIIAALTASSTTSPSHDNEGTSTNFTTLSCLYSFVDTAQDGLVLTCLLHLMHHLAQSLMHSSYASFYLKSLWQVQRQLITDYSGIEMLIQSLYVYQYQVPASSPGVSWIAFLHQCSWGFVTLCMQNRISGTKSKYRTEFENGSNNTSNVQSSVSTISVLEETFSRHLFNNGSLIFHSGYLMRVWWEQWFNGESVSGKKGSVGLHLLLCNLTKAYEVMGQKVDEKLSQEPISRDNEDIYYESSTANRKNTHLLNLSTSRKRNYEEESFSIDENVDTVITKRQRCLVHTNGMHTNIIPNLSEFQTSLWFANLYDSSKADLISIENLDHCLDLILQLFLQFHYSPLSDEDTSKSHRPTVSYIVNLQLWHVLQAWFMTHYPPLARHIVFLAQWTQQWMEEFILPRLETLQSLLAMDNESIEIIHSLDHEQVMLELFLLATMLQAAQRFFGILLTVLKTTQHLAHKLCTQVQEECGELVDHIVTVCYNYVTSIIEEGEDTIDKADDWVLTARLLCDALLHSCAYDKLSALVQETLLNFSSTETAMRNDNSEQNNDTTETHNKESFIPRWLHAMKRKMLLPWIQTDVAPFLQTYETS